MASSAIHPNGNNGIHNYAPYVAVGFTLLTNGQAFSIILAILINPLKTVVADRDELRVKFARVSVGTFSKH